MNTLSIEQLRSNYLHDQTTPEDVIDSIHSIINAHQDYHVWIYVLSKDELAPYLNALTLKDPADHPLWGIPFAIKDNIDLEGIPTTAACPEFSYIPSKSATVVQKLIDAGAIPIGKTNMDQFATGLNGTRSPYGVCQNAFVPGYISGGSSSGSAVAVALGMACFSLGSDTAGSGRVPASFNNLLGLKPTRGIVSSTGMVPACRSLDCMTVFTHNAAEANTLLRIIEGFDNEDAFSRENPFENQYRSFGMRKGALRLGVIPAAQLAFFGDHDYALAYQTSLDMLKAEGHSLIEINYAPFSEAAQLLYEGPWVSERYLAIKSLLETKPDTVLPVIRDIIEPGAELNATALFSAFYRLQALKQHCEQQLAQVDCLLTPTAGKCFTIEEMLSEPIKLNSELGFYTNFMNLLDMAAVALPTQFTSKGLPFGVTLSSSACSDRSLLSIAHQLESYFKVANVQACSTSSVADTGYIDVLVCGAHLEGLPLNWQLKERGAKLKERTHTAATYRMYALAGGPPFRPGLILDKEKGAAIEVEVWSVPSAQFGSFVNGIPAPLGIGKVQLADSRFVSGFICEPYGIDGAEEITHLGGWRTYIKQLSQ